MAWNFLFWTCFGSVVYQALSEVFLYRRFNIQIKNLVVLVFISLVPSPQYVGAPTPDIRAHVRLVLVSIYWYCYELVIRETTALAFIAKLWQN